LKILCESVAFPAVVLPNAKVDVSVTWNDLLSAALTVGRPNRLLPPSVGSPAWYEGIFRISLVRMSIEQRGATGVRFRRTQTAKTLDPTEKGSVNYFLGMIFCKMFATLRLNTPWLLHLDVYRPMLDVVLSGRSRPDLIGMTASGDWLAFECKGRLSRPGAKAKAAAKTQAQRVVSVGGTPCLLNVGAITFFRDNVVEFFWADPTPRRRRSELKLPDPGELWRHYYEPAAQLALPELSYRAPGELSEIQRLLEELDITVSVHPVLVEPITRGDWRETIEVARGRRDLMLSQGYRPDGIRVRAGPSWSAPLPESFAQPG
jgi:hypothetical protein